MTVWRPTEREYFAHLGRVAARVGRIAEDSERLAGVRAARHVRVGRGGRTTGEDEQQAAENFQLKR